MPDAFVAFGSWRIRFAEPLTADHRRLRLFALPDGIDIADHSVIEDLAARIDPSTGHAVEADGTRRPLAPGAKVSNLFGPDIPLATVQKIERGYRIHHRLTRLDPAVVHLIRVGPPRDADQRLADALWSAFDADHLPLNNWECLYIKGLPDTELEQKFEIEQPFDYFRLCRAWWRRLDDGDVAGFRPQLGDEIQYWSYDNHFYDIADNERGDRGYVSIMQYCKRKTEWDAPMFTFKKKIFDADRRERWERNYDNQWVAGDPRTALEEFFGYPLKPLPQWRRTRFDLACEAVATGNLFMVNFDDCRVHGADPPAGRLQQCEVEYLKTRGTPSERLIYADFARLIEHVEAFMRSQGLAFRRSNYSKLSFLRDYVAATTT